MSNRNNNLNFRSKLESQYDRYNYNPSVSEFNNNNYQNNNYVDAFKSSQLSVDNEPNIEYEEFEYYLSVSSRDRDDSVYPDVNRYIVKFREFKNVKSIELIQAIIPDKNNVSQEPYLLLKIDELEDVMVSNDRHISDAFAILQMATPITTGGFIQIDKRIHENTIKNFKNPMASLSKMTVSITDANGGLFDFGSDSPAFQKSLQNTFVFKIVTVEKKYSMLNHRNVF
jgi:hypothetical protein